MPRSSTRRRSSGCRDRSGNTERRARGNERTETCDRRNQPRWPPSSTHGKMRLSAPSRAGREPERATATKPHPHHHICAVPDQRSQRVGLARVRSGRGDRRPRRREPFEAMPQASRVSSWLARPAISPDEAARIARWSSTTRWQSPARPGPAQRCAAQCRATGSWEHPPPLPCRVSGSWPACAPGSPGTRKPCRARCGRQTRSASTARETRESSGAL